MMRRESNELCPSCGVKGKPVKPVTIASLVSGAARSRAGRDDGFRFCSVPTCDTAYYHPETGEKFTRAEVKVRIGQKEPASPRPLCYCFGHSFEEIEAEVAASGTSTVPDSITALCRKGLDRCEETNPQGSCCLGNVRRAAKATQVALGVHSGTPATPGHKMDAGDGDACCAG